jgi:hypothetical protein
MKTKSKVQVHSGGRKVVQGPRLNEAHEARKENQEHKSRFKAGPHARTDANAGRKTPLISDHQVATPPAGIEAEARS